MLVLRELDSVDLLDAVPYCLTGEVPLGYGTGDYARGHVLNVDESFLPGWRAPGVFSYQGLTGCAAI